MELLTCVSAAQICSWLNSGDENGFSIQRQPDKSYLIKFTDAEEIIAECISEALLDGIGLCYDSVITVFEDEERAGA